MSVLISLVPEYEVTIPYQSNEDGEFVTHTLHERHTRDIHESGAWFYKMDAFGNKMHLKLQRNTQLIKPGLELETRHENGDVTRTPVKSDLFFHGKETSDPGSLVAISNDKGLVRYLFNLNCNNYKNVNIGVVALKSYIGFCLYSYSS